MYLPICERCYKDRGKPVETLQKDVEEHKAIWCCIYGGIIPIEKQTPCFCIYQLEHLVGSQ
jgi:hypothetical protein